ncbi:hypothetical protein N8979_00915 [bacterium]|nr:hypothetical protein [bacterium]
MTRLPIDHLVNLDAYPIADPDSPECQALVAQMAQRYAEESVCLMPGFLTEKAVKLMAAEATAATPGSFRCDDTHNVYLERDDQSLPEGHPRRRRETTRLNVVGCDQLAHDGGLWSLYGWDPLRDFIGRVLGFDDFHRFADPIGAMAINVMNETDMHGWHFDEALFTVSVMLQAPDGGGKFEFVRGLRNDQHDDYQGLGTVLDGQATDITKILITPGALLLFGGRNLLHRVTGVQGERTRFIATLCYRDRPGVTNSKEVRQLFYGRSEPVVTMPAN